MVRSGILTSRFWLSVSRQRVLRPLVKHWRAQSILIVVYLDDGLGTAATYFDCLRSAAAVRADLF